MKPNIILIMTDDQGYGELSCLGNTDFKTPNFDDLAANGALFTDFYSNSPVCSPSRAALLTGRYPGNAGVRAILSGHRRASGINQNAPTIASVLKQNGYYTGLVGKWHLGLAEQSRPNNNGFDYFYGFMAGCIDYYSHIFYWGANANGQNPTHDLWENENEIYNNGKYFTELVTEKSVEFIKDNKDEPFMLFTAYNAPHYPLHAPGKYVDRFKDLPEDRRILAAMIAAVDDGVGEIVKTLKEQGIYENTIIFFQSDNGPSRESRNFLDGTQGVYNGSSAGKFKGHKFSLFEGGIRIPAILSYPAEVNSCVINKPCAAMDIFPTICELAGVDYSGYVDGLSITELLKGGDEDVHDMLFWEMDKQTAVRCGKYKLVLNGVTEEQTKKEKAVSEYDKPETVFLADIETDPAETINIATKYPNITKELTNEALKWRKGIESEWTEKWAKNYSVT